jgi:hypothetical protein
LIQLEKLRISRLKQAQKTESAVAVEEVHMVEEAIAAEEATTFPSRKILRPLPPRFEAQNKSNHILNHAHRIIVTAKSSLMTKNAFYSFYKHSDFWRSLRPFVSPTSGPNVVCVCRIAQT